MRLTKLQGLWCSALFFVTFGVTSSLFPPQRPAQAQRTAKATIPHIPCTAGAPFFTVRHSPTGVSISAEFNCPEGGNIPCTVRYGVDLYWYDPTLGIWHYYGPACTSGFQQTILCGKENSYGCFIQFIQLPPGVLYEVVMTTERWSGGAWGQRVSHVYDFYVS